MIGYPGTNVVVLGAGDVRLAAVGGLSQMRALTAAGRTNAGTVTVTGAVVGDRVLLALGTPTAGTGPLQAANSLFAAAVTTANQVQQSTSSDLSGSTYVFLLVPGG